MTGAAPASLITTIALVGLGGALGAVARVRLTTWVGSRGARRHTGAAFATSPQPRLPVGTMVVNLLGALAIGLVAGGSSFDAGAFVAEGLASHAWALGVTGLLGSFTTVSSLALQTLELADKGAPGRAALNLGATLVAGIAAVTLGYAVGTQLWAPSLWGAA